MTEKKSRVLYSHELGKKFREALKKPHSHQLSVCAELGISRNTHKMWMSAEAEPGSQLALYQQEVIAGLNDQRVADLEDMEKSLKAAKGSHATPTLNMRLWRHKNRFQMFEADDIKKHEHTGKDGGPIETAVGTMSDAQLDAIIASRGASEGEEEGE